jgi:RHS repeat-associated protein
VQILTKYFALQSSLRFPPVMVPPATPMRRGSTAAHHTSLDYDRGYTGHEQLDDTGLIHMNGRIYDPELGRMLSPDPFVQVPEYSQNFNRYSYVLNNPLNTTDPSGYSWLSQAFDGAGDWLKENWRTVASIAVGALLVWSGIGASLFWGLHGLTGASIVGTHAAVVYGGIGAITGSIMGGMNAALNGGNVGDIARGALVGGIEGGLSGGLHMVGGSVQMSAANIVGHGVVEGAANEAMGGKFQDGFLSAAASAATAVSGLSDPEKDYRNNPDYQHVKSPDGKNGPAGPIPEGVYRIKVRPSGLKYNQPAYHLEPISGNAIKYGRGGPKGPFVIHTGTGIGCIVPGNVNEGAYNYQASRNQYAKITRFMNQFRPHGDHYGTLYVHRSL